MAHQTQDDGFHEIQLNGKQLVFLFMAATVVSVVIFLCGVLVGRGVRAERASSVGEASGLGTVPPADAPATPAPAVAPAGADPTKAAPPPAVDDLSYFNRLEKSTPAAEELKPEAQPSSHAAIPETKSPPEPAKPAPPKPASASAAAAAAPATATAAEPSGGGYAVQVAALNVRSEADAIARRLSTKGYAAYVVAPGNGASMFRVRVGKFGSRREAESVATRLQKEEQFKPWITR